MNIETGRKLTDQQQERLREKYLLREKVTADFRRVLFDFIAEHSDEHDAFKQLKLVERKFRLSLSREERAVYSLTYIEKDIYDELLSMNELRKSFLAEGFSLDEKDALDALALIELLVIASEWLNQFLHVRSNYAIMPQSYSSDTHSESY